MLRLVQRELFEKIRGPETEWNVQCNELGACMVQEEHQTCPYKNQQLRTLQQNAICTFLQGKVELTWNNRQMTPK
jgi:hypothetical protein